MCHANDGTFNEEKKEEVTSLDSDAQFFTPLNPEDNQPSVYKGYVTVSYAAAPVAYRIVDVAHTGIEGRQCHTLAVSSFRMSILMADIVRGKMSTEILRKAASATVIERLQRLAYIVGEQMRRDQAYRAKLRIPRSCCIGSPAPSSTRVVWRRVCSSPRQGDLLDESQIRTGRMPLGMHVRRHRLSEERQFPVVLGEVAVREGKGIAIELA